MVRRTTIILGAALPLVIAAACAENADVQETEAPEIKVTAEKITAGQPIPKEFTDDGEDVSPALQWTSLPEGTQQIALICDDPDAPTPQPWVHWVMYGIPADAEGLPRGVPKDETLSAPPALKGARQGKNGWGTIGYRGPAPPPGKVHHYHFKVYALDTALDLKPGLDKDGLLKAIEGHIVGQGELVGTYKR